MPQGYSDLARTQTSRLVANGTHSKRRSSSKSGSPHLPRQEAQEGISGMRLFFGLLLAAFACVACSAETSGKTASAWTQFVHVDGQPDPVPAQWVSTPQGKFAHSIKIPNPVPKDSGYREGISSQEYFDYLCKTEAGEFIFKTLDNVDGFYFMRPPKRPTDADLKDRYKLEAPEIQRLFQLMRETPAARAELFVNPPWNQYVFVEEPSAGSTTKPIFIHSSGYRQGVSPMKSASTKFKKSEFGLTWRGLRRTRDRELSIAGGEWIVLELKSETVLAVMRTFGLSPRLKRSSSQVWWLNASQCPGAKKRRTAAGNASQLYEFMAKVLKPAASDRK